MMSIVDMSQLDTIEREVGVSSLPTRANLPRALRYAYVSDLK